MEYSKQNRINDAEVWKRVKFAEKYDEKDLAELLTLTHLVWGHVRKLVIVVKKAHRRKLAKKANKEKWNPRRLAGEIDALGERRFGGRKVKIVPVTAGTLNDVCKKNRTLANSFSAFGDRPRKSVLKGNVFQKNLSVAILELNHLKKSASKLCKKLEAMKLWSDSSKHRL